MRQNQNRVEAQQSQMSTERAGTLLGHLPEKKPSANRFVSLAKLIHAILKIRQRCMYCTG